MLPVLGAPLAAASVVLALLPAAAPSTVGPGSGAGPAPRPTAAVAWGAPVDGPVSVLDRFDPPVRRWLPGHRGVDLDAAMGDVVRAAGPGTVTWAAPLAGRGVVVVRHPDGRRTTYEPVDAVVTVGDDVTTGDRIGRVAPGVGHCGGVPSCLHWGLRRGDDYLDPMLLLRRGRPVLLP
ncbi:MAG: M23 family metallopeptidase [Actinomycetales bacterium]|nr:M23 family metallopeptidase [Actinomycetales bacterium]